MTAMEHDFRAWVRFAEDDFGALLTLQERGGYPQHCAFFAQQCAEKYLKAFLAFHEIRAELSIE